MERARKVILVEVTPEAPSSGRAKAKKEDSGILKSQKEAFRISPDALVVDNSYPRETAKQSLKSAKIAAYQVNVGARKAWPSSEYYALWRKSPENEDVYQLLIGLRSHIKPEWEKYVNRAGTRKANRAKVDDTTITDTTTSGEDVEDAAPSTYSDPFSDSVGE